MKSRVSPARRSSGQVGAGGTARKTPDPTAAATCYRRQRGVDHFGAAPVR